MQTGDQIQLKGRVADGLKVRGVTPRHYGVVQSVAGNDVSVRFEGLDFDLWVLGREIIKVQS